MPEFNSVFDLDKALQPILKQIVEAVASKVEDKIKANIDEYVYIDRNEYYYNGTNMPTYEFRESWKSSEAKSIPSGYQSEIASDKDSMRYDPDTFLHGSYWGDVREFLGEIINEGKAGNLFGDDNFWNKPRPFFDKTIQSLINDGLINKWFKEEFKKRGIIVE